MKKYFIFTILCLSMTYTLLAQHPATAQTFEDDSPKFSPPPPPPPPKPTEISQPVREIEVYSPPPPPVKEFELPKSAIEVHSPPPMCPPMGNATPRNTNFETTTPEYHIENNSSSSVYVSNSTSVQTAALPPQTIMQSYYLQKPSAEEALHKLIVMADVGKAFIVGFQTQKKSYWKDNAITARRHIYEMLNTAVFLPTKSFAKAQPLMRDIYISLNEVVENRNISDSLPVIYERLQRCNTHYEKLSATLNEILIKSE